jgi:post-segregation antitoxin (ccd killing protein)
MRSRDDAKAGAPTNRQRHTHSDLYAKAKRLGINASQGAEKAIADEYAALRAKELRAAIAAELAAIDKFVEKHGSFSERVHAY